MLVVGGDFQRDEIIKRVEDLFGAWQQGEVRKPDFPRPPARSTRSTYLVDRPGSAQSNIIIANLAIARTHPDYFPALLMHTILGANASSRLFMNLREEKGYTYGAYSNLDARRDAGSFRATAEVRSPVTGDSLKEFFHEFGRIRDEEVSEKELHDAKSYLTGIFPIRLETLDGLIDQLVQIKMFSLPADYLLTYRDRVQAVTREEIQRAAREYVTPDHAAIVIVGDAAALGDQIKPYADQVELYDSTGRRKEQGGGMDAGMTNNMNQATANESDGIFGTWNLDVKTPFGQHPATLVLTRGADGRIEGAIKSQLGDGALSNLRPSGDGFEATVSLALQGRSFDAQVSARAEGSEMSGTIKVNNLPIPAPALKFTGRKAVSGQ